MSVHLPTTISQLKADVVSTIQSINWSYSPGSAEIWAERDYIEDNNADKVFAIRVDGIEMLDLDDVAMIDGQVEETDVLFTIEVDLTGKAIEKETIGAECFADIYLKLLASTSPTIQGFTGIFQDSQPSFQDEIDDINSARWEMPFRLRYLRDKRTI